MARPVRQEVVVVMATWLRGEVVGCGDASGAGDASYGDGTDEDLTKTPGPTH